MRLAALVWLAFTLLAAPAAALSDTVGLLVSGEGGSYAEVTEAIQAELKSQPESRVRVAVVGTAAADELARAGPRLLITVGTRAAQALDLLGSGLFDPHIVLSSTFELPEIAEAMVSNRDDKANAIKLVMRNPACVW